jgi:integrase/recombinase XerD
MSSLAPTLETYFTDRLIRQRRVSPHTIASYRDTFRLLLGYINRTTGTPPSRLEITDLDAARIGAFFSTSSTSAGTPPALATSGSPRSTPSFTTARCATPSTPP